VCENTKYKIEFIQFDDNKPQQLIILSHYDGEYPSIVKQIEEEVYQYFRDFNIIRIKIQSLISNEGIPETDTEKKLFWTQTNYFEFHYKIPLEKDRQGEKFKKLLNICRSKYRFNLDNLDLSRIQFKQIDEKNFHYINIIRLFNLGREKAFSINDEIVEYVTRDNLPLSTIKHAFIVYDSHFHSNNN